MLVIEVVRTGILLEVSLIRGNGTFGVYVHSIEVGIVNRSTNKNGQGRSTIERFVAVVYRTFITFQCLFVGTTYCVAFLE